MAGLIGDRTGVAKGMMGVAQMSLLDGRYAEARDGMMQVDPIFEAVGDRWLYLSAIGVLGRALQYLGEHEQARDTALKQLDGSIELGDGTMMAMALHDLASYAAQSGDFERGLRLDGASRALVDRLGGGAPTALIGVLQPDELAAAAGVAADAINRWFAEGRELSEEAALALARESVESSPT